MFVPLILGGGGGISYASATQSPEPLAPPRREFPLHCRGGAGLVFDTLLATPDSSTVLLLLSFIANATAGGPTGEALQPGACAWVDRPLSNEEPRRIRFSLGVDDSTPRFSISDSGMYWGFLARNSEPGFLTGVGYRHWHASSPPRPGGVAGVAGSAAGASSSTARSVLPFPVRYLVLIPVGWLLIGYAPSMMLLARWSGWRRLAALYPAQTMQSGTAFRSGQIAVNMTTYRAGVLFSMDGSYLHATMSVLARPGHRRLSIPWADVVVSPAEWPWFPFKGYPMMRLAVSREPTVRILMKLDDGRRIVAASKGRISLDAGASQRPSGPGRSMTQGA